MKRPSGRSGEEFGWNGPYTKAVLRPDEGFVNVSSGLDPRGFTDGSLRQGECVNGAAGGDGNVFFAINREGHGWGVNRAAHLEVPQRLA